MNLIKFYVNNSYEIAKGTSTISYYDTKDSIDIDGFTILECTPSNVIGLVNRGDNCIIVNNEIIQCIYIVDENIITYKGISVGDNVDKSGDACNNIRQPIIMIIQKKVLLIQMWKKFGFGLHISLTVPKLLLNRCVM